MEIKNDIVIGQRAAFLFKSKKQKFVQNRYRSIEKNWRTLFNFGYVVDQISQVLPHGGGYQHVLVLTPWRANILPATTYGSNGITVGVVIHTEYEPQEKALFEPEHDDGGHRKRAALIWTPPVDVKRQILAPIRYLRFSFKAKPDGTIDFKHMIESEGNELLPQVQSHPLLNVFLKDTRFELYGTTQKDCQNCVNFSWDEEYSNEDEETGLEEDWVWIEECLKGLFPRGCPLAPTASKCESFVRK